MASTGRVDALDSLVQQEITEFLSEVEAILAQIPRDVESGQPVDSVLLQAEWLLRDVLTIERLLPRPDGEALTEAVQAVGFIWNGVAEWGFFSC